MPQIASFEVCSQLPGGGAGTCMMDTDCSAAANQTCAAGSCVCADGQPVGAASNCAGCGKSCPVGKVCADGACSDCADGSNLGSDGACANCGDACPGGSGCSAGACACPGGGAVGLDANCGFCGDACLAGTASVAGACAPANVPGEHPPRMQADETALTICFLRERIAIRKERSRRASAAAPVAAPAWLSCLPTSQCPCGNRGAHQMSPKGLLVTSAFATTNFPLGKEDQILTRFVFSGKFGHTLPGGSKHICLLF